ncbi:MAG: hypothetical protein ACI92I_000106 [Acidimicrobiales bacterium]|jgi:hypothetical protein
MNDLDPQLLNAVRERIEIGYPYEKIQAELHEAGYSDEEIKLVYTACNDFAVEADTSAPAQTENEAEKTVEGGDIKSAQSEPKKRKHSVLGITLAVIGFILILGIIGGTFWVISGKVWPVA